MCNAHFRRHMAGIEVFPFPLRLNPVANRLHLSTNGLGRVWLFDFGAYFAVIVRCAIPNRSTLPRGEGEMVAASWQKDGALVHGFKARIF